MQFVQNNIAALFERDRVVPVVTLNRVEEVQPVLERLLSLGVYCIEITLRTEAAFECIAECKRLAPDNFRVGVGTVLNAAQIERCAALSVDFMVSPGSTPELLKRMQASGIAYLPGVQTASEIMAALEAGCRYLKFFPFNIAGGITALNHYAKVFPQVRFSPSGGIGADNYQEVLALPNVAAVGGSWLL